jgi:uncharacterized cupin superfamily protein
MDKGWQLLRYNEVPPQHFGSNPKTVDVRFYRDQLGMSGGGMTVMRLGPSVTTPGHTHKSQEEVYMSLSDQVVIKLGDEVVQLKPFDAVRVSKDVSRAMRNVGKAQATIIAFGTPNTGPGDAVNLQNFWR